MTPECLEKFDPEDQWRCMFFAGACAPLQWCCCPPSNTPHWVSSQMLPRHTQSQSTSPPTSRRRCSSCKANTTTGRQEPDACCAGCSDSAGLPPFVCVLLRSLTPRRKSPHHQPIIRWTTTSTANCTASTTPASLAASLRRPSWTLSPAAQARGASVRFDRLIGLNRVKCVRHIFFASRLHSHNERPCHIKTPTLPPSLFN